MEDKGIVLGRNPVLEYLYRSERDRDIEIHVSQNAHGKIIDTIIQTARAKNIPIHRREKGFFSSFGPSSLHQGVAMSRTELVHDQGDDADGFLEKTAAKKGVLVLLDRITDPHNLGSIIRTAEALGCNGIVLPRSHAAGITPAVIKASAGATAHITAIQIPNVAGFLDEAKSHGFWIIGTADDGTTDIGDLNSLRPCVVIVGGEHEGMRRLTGEKCDVIVRIPLTGAISSLNASVAAGIMLYEIMRKR